MNHPKFTLRKLSIGLVSLGAGVALSGTLYPQNTVTVYAETPVTESTTLEKNEEIDNTSSITRPIAVEDPKVVQANENKEGEAVDSSSTLDLPKSDEETTSPEALTNENASESEVKVAENTSSSEEKATEKEERAVQYVEKEVDDYSTNVEKPNETVSSTVDKTPKELFTVSRTAEVGQDGVVTVTTQIVPKEIDKGAEIVVLVDTSKKMDVEAKKTAKANIVELVKKMTEPNDVYNSRNSVRVIGFNRKLSEAQEVTSANVETTVEKLFTDAEQNYNWGVDMQGAIHEARRILESEKSGKRKHIVLLSQGESTFSYDLTDDVKAAPKYKKIDEDKVVHTNPLLPWPFTFDVTVRRANLLDDAKSLISFLNKVGITRFDKALDDVSTIAGITKLIGIIAKDPLDYINLVDVDSSQLEEKNFNYEKQIGEGYHFRSFYERKVEPLTFRNQIVSKIKHNLTTELKKAELPTNTLSYIAEKLGLTNTSEKAIDLFANSLVDYIFYGRKNIFNNHNLSAQAEAKIATKNGIHVYAVDVTKDKAGEEKNKNKFDEYLKKMSGDDKKFLSVDENVAEKFKDALTKVTLVDTIENDAEVIGKLSHPKAKLTTPSSSSSWLTSWFSSSKATITWNLDKEDLIKAYQTNKPLSLTYQLKYKGKKNSNSQKLVSTEISHEINDKVGKKVYSSLKVSLSHKTKKVSVPVPIEPQVPDKPIDMPKIENETPKGTPEIPRQTEPNVPETTLPMQPELPKETGKTGNNVEPESPKPIEDSTDDSANKPDSTIPKATDNIIIPDTSRPMKPESTDEIDHAKNNVEPETPKLIEKPIDDSANKPKLATPKATDNIIIPNPTLPMKPETAEETEKLGNNVKPESPKPIEDTDSSAGTPKLDIPKVTDTPDLSRPMKPETAEETEKLGNNVEPESPKPIEDTDSSAGTPKLDIPKVTDTPDLSRPMKPESTEEIDKAENSDTPDSSKTIKDSDNSAPISTIKDKVNAETVANQVELAMNQKSRLSENMEKVSSVNRSNEKSDTLPSTGQADSPIYTLTALSLLVGAQVLYRTKRKQESK
ncbi:serum opacification factor [Streptococcus suis]|uniref:serum opacification factor n=2 Tax=Streptococcus suis TaxID=1307 RepID=UPI000CF4E252|nr:serum opacification factor [Streptococcus suis]MBY4959736.1 serum opacification factor [Streptococcus suis]NQK84019.1 VWA domain-containing protein [Streptococcus suis]NQM09271.1 VWA domain-containing protein [Streptococcus suis]UUM44916.1 serum opacification factor [Streptococcus suis]HEL1546202.1 VWA domain-containing protein [Streptococcus suis]